tara:strand:+ start:433 stop:1095 length:663 start_codon:yes stop_codon:yes gene_type:complete
MKNVLGRDAWWLETSEIREKYNSDLLDFVPQNSEPSTQGPMDVWVRNTLHSIMEGMEKPISILDIGCNYGKHLGMFKNEMGIDEVWGTDVSEKIKAISHDYVKRYFGYSERDIPIRVGFFEDMKWSRSFSITFCSNVIEHIPDWFEFFTNLLYISKRASLVIVPKDQSWNWTEDHVHIFDDEKILEMNNYAINNGFVSRTDIVEDNTSPGQYWYCILYTK